MTFYYKDSNSCPDCNSAKMEWDAFVQENDGVLINGYSIQFNTMDCSKDDKNVKETLKQNNITELPAVTMFINGNNLNYRYQITKTDLNDFINRMFNLVS
jgi:glutaredoxin